MEKSNWPFAIKWVVLITLLSDVNQMSYIGSSMSLIKSFKSWLKSYNGAREIFVTFPSNQNVQEHVKRDENLHKRKETEVGGSNESKSSITSNSTRGLTLWESKPKR